MSDFHKLGDGLAFERIAYRTAKDFGRHGWIIFGASFWYLRGTAVHTGRRAH